MKTALTAAEIAAAVEAMNRAASILSNYFDNDERNRRTPDEIGSLCAALFVEAMPLRRVLKNVSVEVSA